MDRGRTRTMDRAAQRRQREPFSVGGTGLGRDDPPQPARLGIYDGIALGGACQADLWRSPFLPTVRALWRVPCFFSRLVSGPKQKHKLLCLCPGRRQGSGVWMEAPTETSILLQVFLRAVVVKQGRDSPGCSASICCVSGSFLAHLSCSCLPTAPYHRYPGRDVTKEA